ncbi:hypothetical protein PFISCL1PPCAC_25851, partial [Pristionchus fissidentatus]
KKKKEEEEQFKEDVKELLNVLPPFIVIEAWSQLSTNNDTREKYICFFSKFAALAGTAARGDTTTHIVEEKVVAPKAEEVESTFSKSVLSADKRFVELFAKQIKKRTALVGSAYNAQHFESGHMPDNERKSERQQRTEETRALRSRCVHLFSPFKFKFWNCAKKVCGRLAVHPNRCATPTQVTPTDFWLISN